MSWKKFGKKRYTDFYDAVVRSQGIPVWVPTEVWYYKTHCGAYIVLYVDNTDDRRLRAFSFVVAGGLDGPGLAQLFLERTPLTATKKNLDSISTAAKELITLSAKIVEHARENE